MRTVDCGSDGASGVQEITLRGTWSEIAVLASAVGEALECVDPWEFQTRVGATIDEAKALRARLNDILRATARPA